MSDHVTPGRGLPGWVDLSAPNVEAARAFYERLLGWTTKEVDVGLDVPWLVFEKDGQPVAGAMQNDQESLDEDAPASWTVSFTVPDLTDAVSDALTLGATVLYGPFSTPLGEVAVLIDPQGAPFSLTQPTAD